MTETYYDLLGVPEDASSSEIEAAYRQRLKETHPDVNDDEDAGQVTQTLIEARDVLVDDEERERYDSLGHAAYVGDADPSDGSDVASAARQAGYGDASGEQSGTSDAGTAAAESTQQRGDRERRARERVAHERAKTTQSGDARTGGSESADTASANTGETQTAADAGGQTGESDADWAGSGSATYSVRAEPDITNQPEVFLPSGRELTVFGLAFTFYPLLLASAVLPAFPLSVNLVVGLCAIGVFGYLQSMPRIAVLVFGGWSLLAPLVLLALPFGVFSLVGISTLLGTWLPFGFSVLTLSILR